jgi:L-alanine-DL-glutamate epimerase-like enolase superfamily enzyme
MFDANEKCDLASARVLLDAARDEGALFVEEPLPAGAVEGYRALARAGGAAVAAGEHLQGRQAFHAFLSERLVAVIQPGVAPHFLPGLFVHLGAAAPAVTWLEDFPLLEPLFDGWPETQRDGTMAPRDVPGHGISLSAANRRQFAV